MYKQCNSNRLKKKWQETRSQVRKEVNEAHDNYVKELIGDIKEDSKPFWRYINNKKSDKQGIPPLQKKNKEMANTDEEKADALNKQFTSVFTSTQYESVPLDKQQTEKMPEVNITEKGVEKILKGINASKAKGPDDIHPRVLKELATELAPVLASFFQQSVEKGIIPDDWKKANICPLYKKNDRSVTSNYRPVSLTCILCKTLEHIMYSNIMRHLEQNNILHANQHAFRKRHSCETQLVNVIEDWANSIDKKQQVDIFILDFEKAFDTVPHELLKSKLHKYGINKKTLNWINSFLSRRSLSMAVHRHQNLSY